VRSTYSDAELKVSKVPIIYISLLGEEASDSEDTLSR
jgi:hypothetical protein